MILMNPLYNGWVRRHRRSRTESRASRRRGARTRPSRTSSGRASRTSAGRRPVAGDARRRGPGRPARRPPRVRLRTPAPERRHVRATAATASSTSTRARPGAARPGSATRCGRRRSSRRSSGIELDDDTIGARRRRLGSGRQPGRARPGPDRPPDPRARPGARRRPPRATTAYLDRLQELRERRTRSPSGTSADGIRRSGRVEWLRASSSQRGARQRSQGEGRPDPRHLRPDHRRRARDRGCQAHAGGLRPRIGAGAARKGCTGAPDRIRTCDLRLRRPTLYPLSYRRARGAVAPRAEGYQVPGRRIRWGRNVRGGSRRSRLVAVPVKVSPVQEGPSATLQDHLSRRLNRLP